VYLNQQQDAYHAFNWTQLVIVELEDYNKAEHKLEKSEGYKAWNFQQMAYSGFVKTTLKIFS